MTWRAQCASRHRQLVGRDVIRTVVILPGEGELAALGGLEEERLIGVGGYSRMPVGLEHGLAVEGGGELVDDLARHGGAGGVLALAVFHFVRNQRLDLDHLAGLGLGGNANPRGWFERHLRIPRLNVFYCLSMI